MSWVEVEFDNACHSISALLERFDYFKEGNCVVHHMFGDNVTQRIRDEYGDAYCTAHFEVPGEMFSLAMEAQVRVFLGRHINVDRC